MNKDLSGKTALITGGAKRVGRAIALGLAEAGANVIINYRSSESEAEELAGEVRQLGVDSWIIKADLMRKDELEGLIDKASDIAGPIQILINNASIFPITDFSSFTLEDLTDSIKVDAWSPIVLGREFCKRVDTGHIINMIDSRVVGYDWMHVAYHAAKYLLGLFTREMAIKFAPKITVNGIAPGLILPPEGKDESYLESLKDRLPMKKVGDPLYIAEAALFLVRSQFITGQVIYVDGGRHLTEVSIG